MGEFWVGAGMGFLAGAALFDYAWRRLRRAEERLAKAIAMETRRAETTGSVAKP
jgi:hypothetical protein